METTNAVNLTMIKLIDKGVSDLSKPLSEEDPESLKHKIALICHLIRTQKKNCRTYVNGM